MDKKEKPVLAEVTWSQCSSLTMVGSRQQLAWNVPPARITLTSDFLQDN